LLSLFIPAILKSKPDHRDKKIIKLLPAQFKTESETAYEKVFSVLDYLSGMTDPYAIELYRKLFGIDIPKHM
jgi:dGTPase